jgi:uncharacterized protein
MSDIEFVPRPLLRGRHTMTLVAWARPRRFPRLPAPRERLFRVASDAQVLAHCHWQPDPPQRATVLVLHGLEGSSRAHYMQGIAEKAFAKGCNVVLLNQRNCGGTEHLSAGLYHSGLTSDPAAVLAELTTVDRLPAVGVIGYSLGGNLALKLAGEYGSGSPPALRSTCAVSPTLDLAACVSAIERRGNWMYQWNFVRHLKGRMRRKARCFPERYTLGRLRSIRTIRAFDELITAPAHGFRDANDYYHRASAMRVVDRIRIPALIITAENDPFVPPASFRSPPVTGNPHIQVILTRFGGHCAFLGPPSAADDGYWAERMAVEFVLRQMT